MVGFDMSIDRKGDKEGRSGRGMSKGVMVVAK
jgi:hypothetical protein